MSGEPLKELNLVKTDEKKVDADISHDSDIEVVAVIVNVQPPPVDMDIRVVNAVEHDQADDGLPEWADADSSGDFPADGQVASIARKVVDLEAPSDSDRDYDSDEKWTKRTASWMR